ncbi:c-type cytochrome [Mesorhizobium sangaii]|uniref:Cytochrome c556 n=1 Tax=Mesorhizobium sangaii TaxID=505389 RepID=A0A841P661_9HYPH|nr:cytochrome c [Mesorhizobium sangaii]MBB6410814.1 cytochrome c556 [Mesorhizobium sangaii]
MNIEVAACPHWGAHNKRIVLAVGLALACVSGLAAAKVGSEALIEARQASMKQMATAAKSLAGMFNGKVPYDAAEFRDAAETLRDRTGSLLGEFPFGSLGPLSGAKPEIDQDRRSFEALAHHIATLATALAKEAANAPPQINAEMRMGPGTMMMDGGSLLGKRTNAAEPDPATLPAEHLVHMILQDCTSCHSRFRQKIR